MPPPLLPLSLSLSLSLSRGAFRFLAARRSCVSSESRWKASSRLLAVSNFAGTRVAPSERVFLRSLPRPRWSNRVKRRRDYTGGKLGADGSGGKLIGGLFCQALMEYPGGDSFLSAGSTRRARAFLEDAYVSRISEWREPLSVFTRARTQCHYTGTARPDQRGPCGRAWKKPTTHGCSRLTVACHPRSLSVGSVVASVCRVSLRRLKKVGIREGRNRSARSRVG